MTVLDDRVSCAPTGPLLSDAIVEFEHPSLERESLKSSPGAEVLKRGKRLQAQRSLATDERTALLGMLLAALRDVDFVKVAGLLDLRPQRLEKIMHGEETIPASYAQRWESLAMLLHDLHAVLQPRATERWLMTQVPSLGGRAPLEVIRKGGIAQVGALAAKYRDPSFS